MFDFLKAPRLLMIVCCFVLLVGCGGDRVSQVEKTPPVQTSYNRDRPHFG